MTEYTLFTTENCPHCKQIRESLIRKGIVFNEDNFGAEVITDLRINDIFTLEAPVLKIDDKYYTYQQIWKELNK